MFIDNPIWTVPVIALMGRASASYQTCRETGPNQVAIAGEPLKQAIETALTCDKVKLDSIVATPVLTVASAGLIPALLGADAALDFSGRKNASKMRGAFE
jgi:hypothetical protein